MMREICKDDVGKRLLITDRLSPKVLTEVVVEEFQMNVDQTAPACAKLHNTIAGTRYWARVTDYSVVNELPHVMPTAYPRSTGAQQARRALVDTLSGTIRRFEQANHRRVVAVALHRKLTKFADVDGDLLVANVVLNGE